MTSGSNTQNLPDHHASLLLPKSKTAHLNGLNTLFCRNMLGTRAAGGTSVILATLMLHCKEKKMSTSGGYFNLIV